MPSLTDLQTAITSVLQMPGIPLVLRLNSPTRERAFEAYVLSLLVRAIRHSGGTATIVGRNTGDNPTEVIFRGAPGLMGSTAQNFAYVRCNLGSKNFELHADVQYEGASEAVHEVDISIFDHAAGNKVRSIPGLFANARKLNGAIECKFYDSALGVVLGRTFVGLLADCGNLRLKVFATNGHSPGLTRYFSPVSRPARFFGLSPLRPVVEAEFINHSGTIFKKWAGVP